MEIQLISFIQLHNNMNGLSAQKITFFCNLSSSDFSVNRIELIGLAEFSLLFFSKIHFIQIQVMRYNSPVDARQNVPITYTNFALGS